MISGKENLENMKKCPQFENCSIPKCPLDYFMNERVELSNEERCVLQKFVGGSRSKRTKGRISPKMKGLSSFIWEKNKSSDKY